MRGRDKALHFGPIILAAALKRKHGGSAGLSPEGGDGVQQIPVPGGLQEDPFLAGQGKGYSGIGQGRLVVKATSLPCSTEACCRNFNRRGVL